MNTDAPAHSALHRACHRGSLDDLERAINAGANVNQCDPLNRLTPLAYLCSKPSFKAREAALAQRLLQAGANPNAPLADPMATPALSRCLLAGGARRQSLAKAMILAGADVNALCPTSLKTPLCCAASADDSPAAVEMIVFLVARQAPLHHRDREGRSALAIAMLFGSPMITTALIELGALKDMVERQRSRFFHASNEDQRRCKAIALSAMEGDSIKACLSRSAAASNPSRSL